MTQKILLDTDIGTDIDDALCLAYLLMNPECELMGITTVTGEPVERAKLASALCRIAEQEIPIYPGIGTPLIIEQHQKIAQQARALKKWSHETSFPDRQAIPFMAETIRQNPNEITLLSIGPLTNLGLLFAMDREIPKLLKGLVMMAGHFEYANKEIPRIEWNAMGDPHASQIVYANQVPQHRSIGLDVTSQVTLHADDFRKQFTHDLFQPIRDFAEIWFEYSEIVTFHDPLAATTIFDSQICQFEAGLVEVDLVQSDNMGFTGWQPGSGPHEVALSVDPQQFFKHYLSFF